jgi:hypothetical protein
MWLDSASIAKHDLQELIVAADAFEVERVDSRCRIELAGA